MTTITALRAALAQQEQKTVAWMITTKDNRHFIFRMNKPMINHGETLTPLCICREWRSLSEEEIWKDDRIMAENARCGLMMSDLSALARAVQAALKEKNHE